MDRELTFSAPGRVEISGNHTDHQWGCVLTAAIDLNTQALSLIHISEPTRR